MYNYFDTIYLMTVGAILKNITFYVLDMPFYFRPTPVEHLATFCCTIWSHWFSVCVYNQSLFLSLFFVSQWDIFWYTISPYTIGCIWAVAVAQLAEQSGRLQHHRSLVWLQSSEHFIQSMCLLLTVVKTKKEKSGREFYTLFVSTYFFSNAFPVGKVENMFHYAC